MNWFALFQLHQPSWGLDCRTEDVEDWKPIVLKDYSLKRRLAALRHAPPEITTTTAATTATNQQSARLRIPLANAQSFPSDFATAEGDYRGIASPIYHTGDVSKPQLSSSSDVFDIIWYSNYITVATDERYVET